MTEQNHLGATLLQALPCPVYGLDAGGTVRFLNPTASALSAALGSPGLLPVPLRDFISTTDSASDRVEILWPGTSPAKTTTYRLQRFRLTPAAESSLATALLLWEEPASGARDPSATRTLAALGHAVKTPVTTIRLTLHLLLEEKIGPLSDEQRELLAASREDCENMLLQLQALLDFRGA